MLLSVQFPIADLRGFLDDNGRLPKPHWPILTRGDKRPEFIRYFGSIGKNTRGGVPGDSGEPVCQADRAIRLKESPNVVDRAHGLNIPFCCAFRRFSFDGHLAGSFNLGIVATRRDTGPLTIAQSERIIQRLLTLPTTVPCSAEKENAAGIPLALAGPDIAHLYAVASTKLGQKLPPLWAVYNGDPQVFLELYPRDRLKLPSLPRNVDQGGIRLGYGQIPYTTPDGKSHEISAWILKFNDGSAHNRELARTLRLHLLRLHANYQCLSLALNYIKDGAPGLAADSPAATEFNRHLSTILGSINSSESKLNVCGIDISTMPADMDALGAFAGGLMATTRSEDYRTLMREFDLRGIHPQTRARLDDHVGRLFGTPDMECWPPDTASLEGSQCEELMNALTDAFPSWQALQRMVYFRLNVNIAAITAPGNLCDVAFALIMWAMAQGQVTALVQAASHENHSNVRLRTFVARWTAASGTAVLAPAGAG